MTPTELATGFARLRPWSRNGERAVHKPLLALLLLGRIANGQSTPVTFDAIAPQMKTLLEDCGRAGSAKTAHNPFWHMQTDGIWKLEGPAALLARRMGATPTIGELRDPSVHGQFTAEVLSLLKSNPQLIHEIAHQLVEANFPINHAWSSRQADFTATVHE